MLSTQEIQTFINQDAGSMKKKYARVGEAYYNGEHDIKEYRIFFINADGKLEEDKTKSNIRICHPFFTENVDQIVQYILSGKEGFVKSDDPALQSRLDEYFNNNEDFKAELEETLTDVVAKGSAYMYAYVQENKTTAFRCADSLGIVECRKTVTDDGCEYLIYWFVDRTDKDGREIKKIEVWDSKQVWYFTQIDDGEISEDDSEENNPRPHTLLEKGGKLYQSDYGLIPFFRIDNNKRQRSDLALIKDLIDDYDLHSSDFSNNIQDANEVLYVVKGFSGDNLEELMLNIKAKKHIGVDDEGDVDIRTVAIPTEARKEKLELDEKNIYRFGMALNTSGLKDTAATTNIAIKSAYSLLDLRANKLETRLKQFMRKLIQVVLDEINRADNTGYEQKDIYFAFEREVPTNAKEIADVELVEAQKRQAEINTLLTLATHLDNETLMQLVAEHLELDYEEIKDKLPDPDEAASVLTDAQAVIDEAPLDNGGDVI